MNDRETYIFEELRRNPGYLKTGPPRRNAYRVFDNKVERASREMNEGYSPSDLTKSGLRDEFRSGIGRNY